MTTENSLQVREVLKLLNLHEIEGAEQIFSTALSFLLYMQPGETIKYEFGSFEKLASDVIKVRTEINPVVVLDALSGNKVTRFAV